MSSRYYHITLNSNSVNILETMLRGSPNNASDRNSDSNSDKNRGIQHTGMLMHTYRNTE